MAISHDFPQQDANSKRCEAVAYIVSSNIRQKLNPVQRCFDASRIAYRNLIKVSYFMQLSPDAR